ncbi:hypothetical protein [uncultured Polaribacter sp.]|uniref:hypothetical protein n=1 Tax=uncultured Polaribacter sp. TaxID=174711 RepID=UPI002370C850|nr:hypothetical protein [Polaribacter sp.]
MRKVVLLGLAIISFSTYSQEKDIDSRRDVVGDITVNGSGLWTNPVSYAKVKGDVYLFNNWKNIATIISGKGKKYMLSNLNYDTSQDRFVTKTSPDSVFVFGKQSIKQVKVNNKIFKRYLKNDRYDYYEQVAFGKGKEVLKRQVKLIKKGIKDPFTNAYKSDKYVLKTKYFFNSEEGIREFKLRKKSFLSCFGEDSNQVKRIIKMHKITLREDSDFVNIFKFYKKK